MAVNRISGVVSGVVTDNRDPRGLGRVKLARRASRRRERLGRVAAPSAGNRRGIYFLPEVGDEVLVAFDKGDPRRPYIVGCLWGGKAATRPPESNAGGRNDVRVIRSRSGHQIRFDDSPEGERIEIIHSGGSSIVIDDAGTTIKSDGDMTISAGGKLVLEGRSVEVAADTTATVKGTMVEVSGAASTTIRGGIVRIN